MTESFEKMRGFSLVVITALAAASMLIGVVGVELFTDYDSGNSLKKSDAATSSNFFAKNTGASSKRTSGINDANQNDQPKQSADSRTSTNTPNEQEPIQSQQSVSSNTNQYVLVSGRYNSQSRNTKFKTFEIISTSSESIASLVSESGNHSIVAYGENKRKISETPLTLNRKTLPSGRSADSGSFSVPIKINEDIVEITIKRAETIIGSKSAERIAKEIIDEATMRQNRSHCENIPFQQKTYKQPCYAIFDNSPAICEQQLSKRNCRQGMIMANTITPQCSSEEGKGCGYYMDRAIWARAIRDRDSSMCQQITDDAFQGRCEATLKETRQLYSGSIKECTQTAKEIGSESGGYYECIVGTAMYQNKPEQCDEATKENIYPGLSQDLKQFDYYQSDRVYEKLRNACRQQINKKVSIRYGQGKGAYQLAREFYSIPERVNSIFSAVIFSSR